MIKSWIYFFRVFLLILGAIVLTFDALLYNFSEKQKGTLDTISGQQKVESKINTNRFKYQQLQIEQLNKDLDGVQAKIKDQDISLADQKDTLTAQKDELASQKDALVQEAEKRQQIENQGKSIQTSLVDIKAEADAIKQDMKGWQKDYVTVLAQLEKKMDDSQDEEESIKESINSLKADIEKINHPIDNDLTSTPPAPEKKIEEKDEDKP